MLTKEDILNNNFFFLKRKENGEKLENVSKWRKNGKVKLWIRSPEKFSVPIKHGLYSYGYLTNENAHQFDLES